MPTHTLHQQWNLTLGKGSELSRISTLSMTVLKGKTAPALPARKSPLSVHPHIGTVVCSIFTHKILSYLVSRSQERGAVSTIIHIFHSEESGVFRSVFGIWCKSSLTHWVLRCCYSRSKLGAVWSLSPTISPMQSHFYAQELCSSWCLHC